MLAWISDNLATIIVSGIVIAAVAAVVIKLVKDRKNGNNGCGCGCSGCAMADKCHKK